MDGRITKFDASLGRDYSEDGNPNATPNFRAPPIKSPAQVAAEKKKLSEIYNQQSMIFSKDHDMRASFGNNSDRSERRNSFYNFNDNGPLSQMTKNYPPQKGNSNIGIKNIGPESHYG